MLSLSGIFLVFPNLQILSLLLFSTKEPVLSVEPDKILHLSRLCDNSLFFPPIKQKDTLINIIEKVNGNKNDFNYYNIELKMADPAIYSDVASFQSIEKDYQAKQQELKRMNQEHDQLFSELLDLEAK